jgi:DNA modification methylase
MKPFYQDDLATIYQGDAQELLAELIADVMITDPPYGMSYTSGYLDRTIANDDSVDTRNKILEIWGDRPALVFGRWDCAHPVSARMCLTWDKGNWPGMGDLSLPWGPSTEEIYVLGTGFNGKRSGSIISSPRKTGTTLHPNEKPVSLFIQLIEKCPPGIIIDPFMGSGTTLRAAKDCGRKVIGIEIDPKYCEIAAARLRQENLF